MKIIISPAKSLDFESPHPEVNATAPKFLNQAARVNAELRQKSPQELGSLMGISAPLADLNYQRNQNWAVVHNKANSRPAIFAFTGEVYRGFSVGTLDQKFFGLMQDSLRILSGQYGLLRPFDRLQPYRLEMGTKISIDGEKNLYSFWTDAITEELRSQLSKNELLLNLASNEYAKTVRLKELGHQVVTPVFKELKNGQYKVVSVYAKHARGLMARYIIEKNVNDLEGVKGFTLANYRHNESLSSETELIFTR